MPLQNDLSSQDPQHGANLAKLTPDVVKKLTEKLSELMGEDLTGDLGQVRNERGEFLNEEGLPIVEISEPVDVRPEGIDTFAEELPLPHLASLSEPIKERLRQQRESLLDQLEEEERVMEGRDKLVDLEHRQEILQKRKSAAAKEKEKFKETKEMQKKMGKLLLQNLAQARAKEEEQQAADDIADRAKRDSQGDRGKKSVSFAEPFEDEPFLQEGRQNIDWGDITPARLRFTGRPSLLSPTESLPMNKKVVERFPDAPPKPAMIQTPDSDDESEPGSSGEEIDESEPEAIVEEDGFDMDFAQHQREIALQYYEKRDKIGATALAAMSAHSHIGNGDAQPDLSSDVPTFEPEKPSISQFKATRLASSYAAASPSTSLGTSIIPASTARTIQKAIRTGKLDAEDRLVGGEADSASEDEVEGTQELLELLRRGEVYNIGPDGSYLHAVPTSTGPDKPAVLKPSEPTSAHSPIPSNLPPINRPKASKFMLSRAAGRPSQTLPFDQTSKPDAPLSTVERTSPKLPSPLATSDDPKTPFERPLAMNTTVTERPPSRPGSMVAPRVSERAPAKLSSSLIVDSPSFPVPESGPAHVSPATNSPFSMVIESPSFAKPSKNQSRPSRPPTVMSSLPIQERPSTSSDASSSAPPRTGKVSRFMAERL